MSYACHQCGVEVDEGSAFCRKCGAPQIRVSRGDEAPAAANFSAADAAGDIAVSAAPAPGAIDRGVARRQAAKAGLLVAVMLTLSYSLVPFFLALPFAGVLAVQLYLKKLPGQKLSAGMGAGIGLLTGLLGFLVWDVAYLAVMLWCLAFHPDWGPIQNMREQIEAAIRIQANPQAQQIARYWLTPGGLVFTVVFVSIFILILTLVLTAIGGAIGASMAKRRP